jgi:hypothetical protein
MAPPNEDQGKLHPKKSFNEKDNYWKTLLSLEPFVSIGSFEPLHQKPFFFFKGQNKNR